MVSLGGGSSEERCSTIQTPHRPAPTCAQVARGLGLDPGAAPKPRAARRPNDPDRPRPTRPPKPPKSEGGPDAADAGEAGAEGGGGGGGAAKGGRRASSKPPAAPKVKRPRGWNTWAPSDKWQDDPVVDSGEPFREDRDERWVGGPLQALGARAPQGLGPCPSCAAPDPPHSAPLSSPSMQTRAAR